MSHLSTPYVPVILAGGSGTRLWPLSRADYPKQFLALNGERSLLQSTVSRFDGSAAGAPIVVCSEEHRFLTGEQLEATNCEAATIMLEPCARNTAPAIAVAAWSAFEDNPDAVLVVVPADHLIPDVDSFQETILKAVTLANQGSLVTLGVSPTAPETGFGYIVAGSPLAGDSNGFQVSSFVEKPEKDKARDLINEHNAYWNSGIFIFKASAFLDALGALQPQMHGYTRQAIEKAKSDLDFIRLDRTAFEQCDNISVDFAIMEHAQNVVVLPLTSAWSDIGSWDAVHKLSDHDEQGNAGAGDVLHHETKDTYLHSSSRLVVALGTENISVIETPDAVLVIDNANAQGVKQAIERLKGQARPELSTHTTCYRPWGHYESLHLHPRFQVKRISVKPGAKLSLQKHFHRSEHWVVVKGTAIVTNGDQEIMLTENESTYIPLGAMHRLYNPGSIPLELIEVQSGSYLGEDDIVRVGDEYGRA